MNSMKDSYRIIGLNIRGLFGDKNYEFELNQNPNVTILYGLNGTGKTTILKMIKSLLTFDFESINEIIFNSFQLKLENGFSIQYIKGKIKEETQINYFSKRVKTQSEWNPFSKIKTKRPLELRPSQLDLLNLYFTIVNSALSEEFNNIYELPGDLGRYRLIEIYEKSNILRSRKFSPFDLYDILKPIFKDNKLPFPEWYSNIIKHNPVNFIESERLIKFRSKKKKNKKSEIRVINTYSDHLLNLKKNLIKEFNDKSQQLYSTFPKRVIDILKEEKVESLLKSKDLKNKIDSIRMKEKSLISNGLLTSGYKEEPPIDTESLETEDIAKVISLWIKDSDDKYSIFDKLLEIINLFELIINQGHLTDKIIKFDGDNGFYFYSPVTKQKIKGDKLSSGEQHIVVLFYYLIFLAEKNSIVLIDEPEISFHVIWQNNFINHLIKIGEQKSLTFIIATHSPEIIYGRVNLVRKLESN